MKLSERQRKALAMMRLLHVHQQEELLADMERQVIANRVSIRVGKLRKLKIPADRKIEKAFGAAPRLMKRLDPSGR